MKLNDLIIVDDVFKFWFCFNDKDSAILLQLKRLMAGSELKDFFKAFAEFSVLSIIFFGDYIRVVLDFSSLPDSRLCDFYSAILEFSDYEVIA